MSTEATASQNVLQAVGNFSLAAEITELRLADGRTLHIPTAALLQTSNSQAAAENVGGIVADGEQIVIPIAEEHLSVGKRVVPTGTVRLHKTVQEFETDLNEPLALRTFDVERVILNQPVETAPGVRQEGNTTIYPLLEEQLIITKQLILKEEIRVTKRDAERIDTQSVTLRREHMTIERVSS